MCGCRCSLRMSGGGRLEKMGTVRVEIVARGSSRAMRIPRS